MINAAFLNNFINDSSLTKADRNKRIQDFGSTIYYILQASDAERSHPHSAGAKIVGFVKNLSESFRVDVENRDTKKIKKLLKQAINHHLSRKRQKAEEACRKIIISKPLNIHAFPLFLLRCQKV